MRSRLPWLLLLAVAACHAPAVAPVVHKASAAPSSAQPASAAPAKAIKLVAPAGDTATLAGTVLVDPGYIVAQRAGAIVAQGGGNVMAAGLITNDGGGLITNDGASLIVGGQIVAQGPGNVVASGAGNVVAQGGGTIVAQGGGNIVASGAGNIVAQGGGNVVAQGGGNIVAQGGGNAVTRPYRLAAAPQAMLPGAGMLVAAVSLRTHQYLPVGSYLDANGQQQPAYSIYSNAQGKYALYLPKAEQGNVLIVANVPGSLDDRMIYNVITPNAATEQALVDEDTALAGRFLHFAFVERLMGILAADDEGLKHISEIVTFKDSTISQPFKDALDGLIHEFNAAARPYPVARWQDRTLLHQLATRLSDRALAELPKDAPITQDAAGSWAGGNVPAVQTLGTCLRTLREATSKRLAEDPTFFQAHEFDFAGDCHVHYHAKIDVRKPTDPGEYIFTNFLAKNATSAIAEIDNVFIDLGAPKWQGDIDNAAAVEAAAQTVLIELVKVLLLNQDAHDAGLAEIKAFCEAHRDAALADAPTYATATPCPVVK